jgi:hypothetical protein
VRHVGDEVAAHDLQAAKFGDVVQHQHHAERAAVGVLQTGGVHLHDAAAPGAELHVA